MTSKNLRVRVTDRRRFGRPLLDLDPVLLLSTLIVGAILAALFGPVSFWSGVS